MKYLIVAAIFGFAFAAHTFAQVMPPGASDKNLDNRDVKDRSIEMERIKREADKGGGGKSNAEPVIPLKFNEIKEDFEKMQLLQNDIVAAYSKSKIIDYPKIAGSAEEIGKSGTRLKSNLFPPLPAEKKDLKKAKEKKKETGSTEQKKEMLPPPLPPDVKTLIVELDKTLAGFVSNPMFTNPQVVNSADNVKARADLDRIIILSTALKDTAAKTSTK